MTAIQLSDEEWGKMREFLRQELRAYIGLDKYSCRRFIEKLDRSCLGFVQFACALIWLQ